MILYFTPEHEDLKFLFYYTDKSIKFVESDRLELVAESENICDFKSIVEQLYTMNNEELGAKGYDQFVRTRTEGNPSIKDEVKIITVLSYIKQVKNMLETGSLKYKDAIDAFTVKLRESRPHINFDPDFYLLEMRAGLIKTIAPVENMDKLFREEVEADKPYTICSGLREYYSAEKLEKNTFLFVLNIKKIKLRDAESEGIICCVKSDNACDTLVLEAIQLDAVPGTKIELEGSLPMFSSLNYAKIDLKKGKYKAALESFRIEGGHLKFKNQLVILNGAYIKTQIKSGPVS
ncbi:hypothetical protein ENBRE01_0256 [Enteropsectra breve]|nr:hypothetical protein ENBRE01_0256 [Enteropsectra breve]